MGQAYANYFRKTYIVCYRKMPKSKKFTWFSLTPYLESFTPTFGLGTPFFQEFIQIYIVGLLLFLKDVSGTPIFKIQVRTLHHLFAGKTPLMLNKCPPPLPKKKSNNFHAVPAASQPALALLLLAWYCGFTTICRRNGNCVDPNQTDSYRAG